MPTMSTVMIMKSQASNLYVGLLDGTLAMYTRKPGRVALLLVNIKPPLNCFLLPLKCNRYNKELLRHNGSCYVITS